MSTNNQELLNKFVCPLEYSMSVFGGKWKPRILCVICNFKTLRYSQIRKELNGITDIMLSKSLKELEEHDMVIRTQYNEIPPRVEYSLSEKGNSVIDVLLQVAKWGSNNNPHSY